MKFSRFIQYFLLSLPTAWNLITFNRGKVTGVLAWPRNDLLHYKKMCALKAYHYVNITRVLNDVNNTSDSAFSVNVHCIYPRLQHKPSVTLETHQLPALAFHAPLRAKLMWCWLSSSCSDSVILVITRKLLSKLSSWKFMSLSTSSAVNLAFIILTLYTFSVQTFLNAQK